MNAPVADRKKKDGFITGHLRASIEAKYEEVYLKRSEAQKKDKKKRLVIGLAGGMLFLIIWQVLVLTIMDKTPGPIETVVVSFDRIFDEWYYKSIYYSLYRVLLGFVLASAVAIPLGLVMGWNRIVSDLTMPAFEIMRPVSLLSSKTAFYSLPLRGPFSWSP